MSTKSLEILAQELLKHSLKLDPPKRKRKLDHETFIAQMLVFVKELRGWRSLQTPSVTYHAFYKRFCKWKKKKVFEYTFEMLTELYATQQLDEDPFWFKELYLDSTMVLNAKGIDRVGYDYKHKGHFATKLSIICDKNKVPLSCVSFEAQVADIKTVESTIESIPCPLRRHQSVLHLVAADKGYQGKKVACALERSTRFRLVTPPKKNNREKKRFKDMRRAEKKVLKKRHKIENLFATMDQFKRVKERNETMMASYEAFNFLVMAIITTRHLRPPTPNRTS